MLRNAFALVREKKPSILFIDEIHIVASKRKQAGENSGNNVHSRVLATLLNELDGIDSEKQNTVVSKPFF